MHIFHFRKSLVNVLSCLCIFGLVTPVRIWDKFHISLNVHNNQIMRFWGTYLFWIIIILSRVEKLNTYFPPLFLPLSTFSKIKHNSEKIKKPLRMVTWYWLTQPLWSGVGRQLYCCLNFRRHIINYQENKYPVLSKAQMNWSSRREQLEAVTNDRLPDQIRRAKY